MYNTLLKTKSESPNYNTPFYVENVGGQNTFTIHKYMANPSASPDIPALTIEYSYDNIIWYSLGEIAENVFEWSRTIDFDENDRIYVRSENSKFEGSFTIINFTCSAPFNVGGNLLSLNYGIHYNEYDTAISSFQRLFMGSTTITDSTKLYLPKTGSIEGVFGSMFQNCTALISTPVLPKGNSSYDAFGSMFSGCTSLTYTPDLSNVVGMANSAPYMFQNCTALKAIGDSDSIASYMYKGCTSIIDASRAKFVGGYRCHIAGYSGLMPSGRNAFENCTSLKTLPEFSGTIGNFSAIFKGCTALEETPDLSNCTVANESTLDYMFQDCTSLTTVNALPSWSTWSTTLIGGGLMKGMFKGCTALEEFTQPLGAGKGREAWSGMFEGCTSLTTLPENMFTGDELYDSQCYRMFAGCTSLTTPPTLPATTIGSGTYGQMFQNCTALTTAPVLNAVNKSSNSVNNYIGYPYMFSGCTSLTTAPSIPEPVNTTVNLSYMFQRCTGLTTAPALPSKVYSAQYMFSGCTGLTTTPSFNFSNAASVYAMFSGCTGLTTATFTYDKANNISYLFSGCTNLNDVTVGTNAVWTLVTRTGWLSNVSETGNFRYSAGSEKTVTDYGVPATWTPVFTQLPMRENPFYFKNEDSQAITITLRSSGSSGNVNSPNTYYSKDDGETWTKFSTTSGLTLNVGESAWIRNNGKWLYDSYYGGNGQCFVYSTGLYSIGGDIGYMAFGDNYVQGGTYSVTYGGNTSYPYFYAMFHGSTNLISAEHLIIPSDVTFNSVGQNGAFMYMFQDCTSLTTPPPTLTSTVDKYHCFRMFRNCTSLTSTPSLPATTLAEYCYGGMFMNCTSLTTPPSLPATTLAGNCYNIMFMGCTGLTTAPALPATTLTYGCYDNMFNGCTSLTTAPELPATTLISNCYNNMFYGCTSLNYIKVHFTSWPTISKYGTETNNNATYNWTRLTQNTTGTFVKPASLVTYTNVSGNDTDKDSAISKGSNTIPYGWTVETF